MDSDFLSAVISKMPVPTIVCDADGQHVAFNAAARELFPEGDLPRDHPLFRALYGDELSGVEMIIAPIGEPVRTVFVDARPISNASGILVGAIATFQPSAPSPDGHQDILRESVPDRRSRFVSETSRVLSAVSHVDTLLQNFADAAVNSFADWCAIDLTEDGSLVRRVGMAHKSAEQLAVAKEINQRYPAEPDNPVSRVLRTGISELCPVIPDSLLETIAQDPEHYALLRSLSLHSYMIVPLLAGSEVLGAITLVSSNPRYSYDEHDLALAEQVAAHTSLALRNAKLHHTAETRRLEADQARKNLERILEATSEGVCGLDLNGVCTFINGSGAALLAYARDQIVGQDLHALIHHSHPDGTPYPAEHCPIHLSLIEKRASRIEEEVFIRSDGSAFPVEYSTCPIEEGGEILGAIVTFIDVTEKKHRKEELRIAELRFRELFDQLTEGVYQTSPDGELLAVNQALVEMLGYSSEMELRAQDVNQLYVDPTDRVRVLERLHREQRLQNVELRLKRKDGGTITVLENARVITDDRRRVIYYEGTLTVKN